VLWFAFAGVLFEIYRPALHGDFVSDDIGYVPTNPWIQRMHSADVLAILNPWGGPASYTSNWAPVTLFLHATEWHFFGQGTPGYHSVNLCLHALVTTLLIPLFVRAGIHVWVAIVLSALFLVHPANVEAVAWISQLKTLASTAFGLGALLAHPRRPLLAVALFLGAILTKATAFFVLPVAAYWVLVRRREGSIALQRAGWLLAWGALFLMYLSPQFSAFYRGNVAGATLDPDPFVALRTLVALGARYLALAATGIGVSPFHQPPNASSLFDPWWLAGLAAGSLIAWRAFVTLRRVSPEGGFWVWAAFAYAPVSQIFPFLYPIGDRYLYDILPALFGALALTAGEALSRLDERRGAVGKPSLRASPALARVGLFAALAVAAAWSLMSVRASANWQTPWTLTKATARNYPDGMSGHMLKAQAAALKSDAPTAVAELYRAADLGFDRFLFLPTEPTFAAIRNDPGFRAFVSDLAGKWIGMARIRGYDSQPELRVWAQAHMLRGEYAEAVDRLERAAAVGGPQDELTRVELEHARAKLKEKQAAATP